MSPSKPQRTSAGQGQLQVPAKTEQLCDLGHLPLCVLTPVCDNLGLLLAA